MEINSWGIKKGDMMGFADNIKEVWVKGVFMLNANGNTIPTVMLEDEDGAIMPISIGNTEAVSISSVIQNETMPRPMTHDLIDTIIKRLGLKVESALIDEKIEGTYYARLTLNKDGVGMEFDARPSDCIAIALRGDAPIMIDTELFSKDSISKDMFHNLRDCIVLD